jgi:hypothetical protein
MIYFWLFGGVLAYFALGGKWPKGQGPFDERPSGTDSKALSVNDVKAPTSGNAYKVTSFRRSDQIYYVAVRSDAGSKDWISYLFNPTTKVRFLFRANAATVEGLAVLKKDFAL